MGLIISCSKFRPRTFNLRAVDCIREAISEVVMVLNWELFALGASCDLKESGEPSVQLRSMQSQHWPQCHPIHEIS